MRSGAMLVEVIVSLVLLAITIVFGFESITNSLSTVNRTQLQAKTVSLVNFVQTYLAEFRIGTQLPNDLVQTINDAFHTGSTDAFPRIKNIQASITNVPNSTVRYRVVQVEIEKEKGQIERFLLIYGL